VPEAPEQPLTVAQAKRLGELLKPVPKRATGDRGWDVPHRRLNEALYRSRYRTGKKDALTAAETDALLDRLLQRLIDTFPGDPDPVTEQRVGDISDALNEARRFLGIVTFRKKR
jgi:hypothetical protein